MNNYGRVMRVSEYELKFGAKEQDMNIFICFKLSANGNTYVIYSKKDEEYTGKIYYGSLHIGKDKLVSMAPKNGESEIIKDIIWKLINQKPLEGYEVLSCQNIEKIEIIGNDVLNMKPEIVTNLVDLTIPKPIIQEVSNPKKKKHNKILILIIVLLIFAIIFVTYLNINEVLGKGTELICTKEYEHNKLDANISKTVTVYYKRNGTREKIIENTAYIFNNHSDYFNFKDKGLFYEYEPKGDFDGGNKWEDEDNTFRTIAYVTLDDEYYIDNSTKKLSSNISDAQADFKDNGYTCLKQDREE